MKTEVQEKIKIKPLMECLEELPEDKLEELYEISLKTINEKKPNKVKKQEKLEYVYGDILAKYMSKLLFLNEKEIKEIEDSIYGNKTKKISEELIEENYIFQVGDKYLIPEELKEAIEHTKDKETAGGKKNILMDSYLMGNGLLQIDRLIELMNESGYKITKKEILNNVKENNYILKDNIIYINELAEFFNEDNSLLEVKELNDYKIMTMEEAIGTMLLKETIKPNKLIEDKLKKKVKNKKELEQLSEIIFNLITMDEDFYENVDNALEEFNVNLNEEEFDDLYDALEDVCHMMPSWTLNGYAPHDFCDEEDEELSFDDLPEEDKKEIYIFNYVMINGIISIDKMVEILNNHHNLKTNKKEVIKIVKNSDIDDETTIVGNYICYTDFPKEDFDMILSLKKLDKYKVIEDIDELMDEMDINKAKIDFICNDYELDEEIADSLKSMMLFGILNEDTLPMIFENSKNPLSLKKQHALYKDLKSTIRNTRMWILNGFMPAELENTIRKEKIGRNEPCTCGSGKKYKHCCGK